MTITFSQLPAILRVPGTYTEVDASLAGAFVEQKNALIIGQKLSGGTATPEIIVPVTSIPEARTLFGAGSQAALMSQAWLNNNKEQTLYVLPLSDAPAAIKAAGTVSITGTATESGSISLYVGGMLVRTTVDVADSGSDVATAMTAAIGAVIDFPVSATVNGTTDTQVDITAENAGEVGNTIKFALNLAGESDPAGLTITLTQMTSGATNPTLNISSIDEKHYHYIVMPFTDTANLKLLTDELESRFGAVRQLGGRAFAAFSGDFSTTKSFGESLNSPHLTVIGIGDSQGIPFVAAAINGALVSRLLAIDPSSNLTGTPLKGIPVPATHFTFDQRNQLLQSGITTTAISPSSDMLLERQITTYQKSATGTSDTAYLDIQVPETLDAIRQLRRAEIQKRFAGFKLAKTDEVFAPGSKVMTPSTLQAFLLDFYKRVLVEEKTWCQDYATYKETLVVQADATDKDRLNYRDEPTLMGQFLINAGLIQFR